VVESGWGCNSKMHFTDVGRKDVNWTKLAPSG
jgi:hypothetical protein